MLIGLKVGGWGIQPEVEGEEGSDDEGSADETEEPAGAGEEVSAVAMAALQELVEEAGERPRCCR